jgi:hypothetical protein
MGMVRDLLEGHQKIVDLLNQVSESEKQKIKNQKVLLILLMI